MNLYQYCMEYLKDKRNRSPYKIAAALTILLTILSFEIYLWSRMPFIALLVTVALGYLIRFLMQALQQERSAQAERERLKKEALDELRDAYAFGEVLQTELQKEQEAVIHNQDASSAAQAMDLKTMPDSMQKMPDDEI